jgi:hypothetical protein
VVVAEPLQAENPMVVKVTADAVQADAIE